MDAFGLGLLSLMVLMTGLVLWFRPRLRERRRIGATKLYKADDLPEVTIGRLIGTAKAIDGKTATSPVTGKSCLVYSVTVTAIAHGTRSTTVIAEETAGVKFALEDDTGTVIVDPERATCDLDPERHPLRLFAGWHDLAEIEVAFLTRNGVSVSSYTDFKFREGIVAVGETISVVGFGQRGADGVMTLSSSPHLPLTISDNRATTKATAPEIPDARVVK